MEEDKSIKTSTDETSETDSEFSTVADEVNPANEAEGDQEKKTSSSKTQMLIWGVIVLIAVVGTVGIILTRGVDNDDTSTPDGSDVLATVNGEAITEQDIDSMVAQLNMQYQMQGMDPEEDPEVAQEIKSNALFNTIRQNILLDHAKELDLDVDQDKVDEEYQTSVDQFDGGEEEMLEAVDEQMGVGREELLSDIENMLLIQAVAELQESEEITEEDIEEYYEQIKAQQGPDQELPPLEEVREMIKDDMEQQEMIQALSNLFQELLPEAEIEIMDPELEEGVEEIMYGQEDSVPPEPEM